MVPAFAKLSSNEQLTKRRPIMTDAPKNIAATTEESSARFAEEWGKFRNKKDFKTWATDRNVNKAIRARKDLFETLAKFVNAHGGFITSVPGARDVRIEVPKDSDLAARLQTLGWPVFQCGASTRVTGQGIVSVDCLEVVLGKQ